MVYLKKMTKQYVSQIIGFIKPDSRVLDLGCGDGSLLETLIKAKNVKGYGSDINPKNILECIRKNISVVQSDLNQGLPEYQDQSFDYVILSQTIQEMKNPILVMKEMLRVGKKVIITFPNFSYWTIRLQILFGNIPITKELPFQWFDTPNIRFINIKNFKILCKEQKIKIIKEIPLYKSEFLTKLIPNFCSNFLAEKALFVLNGSIN